MAAKTANVVTRGISFSLNSLKLSDGPLAYDEMSREQFDQMMQRGLDEAKRNCARPAEDVFSDLMEGL